MILIPFTRGEYLFVGRHMMMFGYLVELGAEVAT